jgi:hypothetical protein
LQSAAEAVAAAVHDGTGLPTDSARRFGAADADAAAEEGWDLVRSPHGSMQSFVCVFVCLACSPA